MAAQRPTQRQELRRIGEQAFRANPREYNRYRASEAGLTQGGDDYEETPIYNMLSASPALNYIRQAIPEKVEDVEVARRVLDALGVDEAALGAATSSAAQRLPEGAQRWIADLPEKIRKTRLGGFTQEERDAYSKARLKDPELRRNTVEIGKVPEATRNKDRNVKNWKENATQAAGVLGADVASDGLRNIWWFLNAPQAIASIATQHAMHSASKPFTSAPGTNNGAPLLKNRNMRMAATIPAWVGMSLAVGNFAREPGYKAAVPDPDDPTQTANPLAEIGSRYFLGRSGSILPYNEFVKERPDVSQQEYNEYKQFLYSNPSPIKATMDGIHGPEVNFMGKSIPLLTGVLPAVATVMGARRGTRLAGQRLKDSGALEKAQKARLAYKETQSQVRGLENDPTKNGEALTKAKETRAKALREYTTLQEANEREVLKDVLANSAIAGVGTGVAGEVLESMRQAMDYGD